MIGHSPDSPLKSRITTIASTMGRSDRIFFCGNLGNGLSAKIANNYIALINLIAVAEAMNIGIRSGIDKHTMYDIIHNSTGQSFMGDVVCPVPGVVKSASSSNGYTLGYRTEMMPKDLGLAIDQAKEVGAPLVLGGPAIDLYTAAGKDPRCHVLLALDGAAKFVGKGWLEYLVVYGWPPLTRSIVGAARPPMIRSPR